MKFNVKGLVFVGFAAAILSGAAAHAGDNDQNIVTSKAYTDATYQAKLGGASNGIVKAGSTAGSVTYVATSANTAAAITGATGDELNALATVGAVKEAVAAVNTTATTDMTGATADTAGAHGLVPAPAAGDQNKVLDGTGNWVAKQDPLTFDNAPTENSTNPVTSGGVYTALAGKQANLSGTASQVTLGDATYKNIESTAANVDTTTHADSIPTTGAVAGAISTAISNLNSGNTYEVQSNKVTSLSSASTDDQYPSAKLVYDQLATKQGTLTFDSTPTASSTNPVESGGVYSALTTKQDKQVGAAGQGGADSANKDEIVTIDANGYVQASGTKITSTVAANSDDVVTSGAVATAIANAQTTNGNTYQAKSTGLSVGGSGGSWVAAASSVTNDANTVPTTAAVYNAIQAQPASSIPAKNTTNCTDAHPCALVAEGDGFHWRVMAVDSTNQTVAAGTCGDAAGTGCNSNNG